MNAQIVENHEGLYRPQFEHDNCGIGAVVNIKGRKSHSTVMDALRIVENLEHRAGKDAEGKTGDGAVQSVNLSASFWVRREIMGWECFSFHRMS